MKQLSKLENRILALWEGDGSQKKLDDYLSRRKALLDERFRLTTQELEQFYRVSELLIKKSELIIRESIRMYSELHERDIRGEYSNFTYYYIENKMTVEAGCDLSIEDNSGSDYQEISKVLADYYYTNILGNPFCFITLRHQELVNDEFFQRAFNCILDEQMKIQTDWHDGLSYRFPELNNTPVCYAMHNLFDHTYYSLQDIIRITNVNCEINITYEID